MPNLFLNDTRKKTLTRTETKTPEKTNLDSSFCLETSTNQLNTNQTLEQVNRHPDKTRLPSNSSHTLQTSTEDKIIRLTSTFQAKLQKSSSEMEGHTLQKRKFSPYSWTSFQVL